MGPPVKPEDDDKERRRRAYALVPGSRDALRARGPGNEIIRRYYVIRSLIIGKTILRTHAEEILIWPWRCSRRWPSASARRMPRATSRKANIWPRSWTAEAATRPAPCSAGPTRASIWPGPKWDSRSPASEFFNPPNLTPDRETGLGSWTKEQIVKVLRTGERPDGRILAPVMPWRSYSKLTDADAADLVSYLKSLPPVKNPVPAMTGAARSLTGQYDRGHALRRSSEYGAASPHSHAGSRISRSAERTRSVHRIPA